MATITINGNSLDPVTQQSSIMALGINTNDTSNTDYILIQTPAPLTKVQKSELANLGVTILQRVPENTYIAYYPKADLNPVDDLAYVTWAGPYMEQFKIEPSLRSLPPGDAGRRVVNALSSPNSPPDPLAHDLETVEVVFHQNVDPVQIKSALAQAAGLDQNDMVVHDSKARITVSKRRLEQIAKIDGVRHIEQVTGNILFNDVARTLLDIDPVQPPMSTGAEAFRGKGEVVAVCDTGLDTGNPATIHPAFYGRVRNLYPLARTTASDPHGHGTHVSGSVLGNGPIAGGGRLLGAAPEAELVLQSVLNGNGGLNLPVNLNTLFNQPYTADGARVHSNSWGDRVGDSSYSSQSYEVDEFIWNHRDMVVCFAAGNSGQDIAATGRVANGSIGAPGTAKNCITVGATESLRPALSLTYAGINSSLFPVNPIASDPIANNPQGVAAFSSRGPTRDNRYKPDVVAPGSTILSAKSTLATANPIWGISPDSAYMFDAGSSMATPLVAGCAAAIRESFRSRRNVQPSAALVKAMLINGAVPLSGQYSPPEFGSIPNEAEGFGRVSLKNSIAPLDGDTSIQFWDEATALDVDDQETYVFTVLPNTTELRVTLVWTDPPGESLQNDLDLIVKSASGDEWHGNMPSGSSSFDRINNVEQVVWARVPPGQIEITVRAHNIPVSPQSYALVARTV